jgi:hypothetical protein
VTVLRSAGWIEKGADRHVGGQCGSRRLHRLRFIAFFKCPLPLAVSPGAVTHACALVLASM